MAMRHKCDADCAGAASAVPPLRGSRPIPCSRLQVRQRARRTAGHNGPDTRQMADRLVGVEADDTRSRLGCSFARLAIEPIAEIGLKLEVQFSRVAWQDPNRARAPRRRDGSSLPASETRLGV